MFLQTVRFGRLVMELPLSFVPGLLPLRWERCSAPYGALGRTFSQRFQEAMCRRWWGLKGVTTFVWWSCSALGFRGDCHLILILIYTLESENLKSVLSPIYICNTRLSDNKAFDTEILILLQLVQESFAGQSRVVDHVLQFILFGGKNIVSTAKVIWCWESEKCWRREQRLAYRTCSACGSPRVLPAQLCWWWHSGR